jgi:hypothetical protein
LTTGKTAATPPGLRLRAEDADDLAVISACLQDALVSVRDLAYDRAAGCFILVANRFCWEGREPGEPAAGAPFQRTLCGVTFEAVDSVAYRGFSRSEEDRILSLLAIRPIPGRWRGAAGSATAIDLEFSGAAAIRLTVRAIACRARDVGEPWPTRWKPNHPLDEPT